MLQILIFSFWGKLKCKSSKCILPAAKTVAWVQHLFLYYLFTYTYLFCLNIMTSKLLSACNKDNKLRDHQKLTFFIFKRISQRLPFQNFLRAFDHIKCRNTKPFMVYYSEGGVPPHPSIFFETSPPPIKTDAPHGVPPHLKMMSHSSENPPPPSTHWNVKHPSIKPFLEKAQ